MKKYRDCQLKGMILQCLIDGEKTSEQIHSIVQHPDKHHLHAELYALKRRGYLSRDVKTRTYSLTKLGKTHSASPFISIIRRRENIQAKVSAILNDDQAFQEAVRVEVDNRIGSGGHVSGGHSGPAPASASIINDSKVIEALKAKDDEIARLQMQLLHLKKSQAPTGPMHTGPGQPAKTPEQVREEKLRIRRRRKLADMYASRNMLLDAAFFAKWGDLRPYKLKYKPWLSENSIEIMSKSNPEIRRGHAHRQPIPPQAVMQCQFHIVKMDSKGITIAGRGLPDGQARMSF